MGGNIASPSETNEEVKGAGWRKKELGKVGKLVEEEVAKKKKEKQHGHLAVC